MKFTQIILTATLFVTGILSTQAQNQDNSIPAAAVPLPTAQECKAFLEKNKVSKDIVVTSSGLQYKVIEEGDGQKPSTTDKVSLHYNISLINGTKIVDTFNDKPWIHQLDEAMPGMQEAVLMMPVGAKWVLYIPAALAFGKEGYKDVPPGATLICEVRLLDIIQ